MMEKKLKEQTLQMHLKRWKQVTLQVKNLLRKKKSALRYIIKMTNIRKKKLKYIDMMERIVLWQLTENPYH